MADNPLKRLLDAGAQFAEMSQATAERLVGESVKAGDVRRSDAAKTVQSLADRGRESTELAVHRVQAEIARQLARLADRFDAFEDRIQQLTSALAGRLGRPVPRAVSTSPSRSLPSGSSASSPRGVVTGDSSGDLTPLSRSSRTCSSTRGTAKKAAPRPAKKTARKVAGPAKRTAAAAGGTTSRATKTARKVGSPAKKAAPKPASKASGAASRATKKAASS